MRTEKTILQHKNRTDSESGLRSRRTKREFEMFGVLGDRVGTRLRISAYAALVPAKRGVSP
jgi:hypothetical protein